MLNHVLACFCFVFLLICVCDCSGQKASVKHSSGKRLETYRLFFSDHHEWLLQQASTLPKPRGLILKNSVLIFGNMLFFNAVGVGGFAGHHHHVSLLMAQVLAYRVLELTIGLPTNQFWSTHYAHDIPHLTSFSDTSMNTHAETSEEVSSRYRLTCFSWSLSSYTYSLSPPFRYRNRTTAKCSLVLPRRPVMVRPAA